MYLILNYMVPVGDTWATIPVSCNPGHPGRPLVAPGGGTAVPLEGKAMVEKADEEQDTLQDGEQWKFPPGYGAFAIECCDCGLQHNMVVDIAKDRSFSVAFWRVYKEDEDTKIVVKEGELAHADNELG